MLPPTGQMYSTVLKLYTYCGLSNVPIPGEGPLEKDTVIWSKATSYTIIWFGEMGNIQYNYLRPHKAIAGHLVNKHPDGEPLKCIVIETPAAFPPTDKGAERRKGWTEITVLQCPHCSGRTIGIDTVIWSKATSYIIILFPFPLICHPLGCHKCIGIQTPATDKLTLRRNTLWPSIQ